uniref:Uncharacterized protein n=1 Tax=Triticum urartu TaxID=4572 RepID=A0A8R7PJ44_TRIUA
MPPSSASQYCSQPELDGVGGSPPSGVVAADVTVEEAVSRDMDEGVSHDTWADDGDGASFLGALFMTTPVTSTSRSSSCDRLRLFVAPAVWDAGTGGGGAHSSAPRVPTSFGKLRMALAPRIRKAARS